jgi:ribosomal protein L20A (L18A)
VVRFYKLRIKRIEKIKPEDLRTIEKNNLNLKQK